MKATLLVLALVALSAFVAVTPVAEADHRCCTHGGHSSKAQADLAFCRP